MYLLSGYRLLQCCCREWDKANRLPVAGPSKNAPRAEDKPAKKQKIECWKCGLVGHYANQCRSEGKKSDGKGKGDGKGKKSY